MLTISSLVHSLRTTLAFQIEAVRSQLSEDGSGERVCLFVTFRDCYSDNVMTAVELIAIHADTSFDAAFQVFFEQGWYRFSTTEPTELQRTFQRLGCGTLVE